MILRFYNSFLLISVFKTIGDYKRILKYVETNNKSNLNLLDGLAYIVRRPRVKRELSYYVLHVLAVKAGVTFRFEGSEKAMPLYQQICNLYERWKTNKYQDTLA